MGLKQLFDKGKCLLGLHQGEWRPVSATECTFVRICTLCHIESRKVEHQWPEWGYLQAEACDQQRVCGRCRSTERQVVHAWSEPDFVSAGSCEQQRLCTRCGTAVAADAKHTFEAWTFTGADGCEQVLSCSRCHAAGTKRRVEHNWTDWQHSNAQNGPVRVCRRCGDLQVQAAPAAASSRPSATAGSPRPSTQPAPSADPARKELFDALRGKMQALGEQTKAFEKVMGALADTVSERLATAGSQPAAGAQPSGRPSPPVFTDDDVEDMLTRAQGGSGASAVPERDQRLVAEWEYQEFPSGGFTSVVRLRLSPDGSFVRSSELWGPMGPTRRSEQGTWRNENGTLALDYDDGQSSEWRYEFYQGGLFFPGSQYKLPWARRR